jgi:hypothetical protein
MFLEFCCDDFVCLILNCELTLCWSLFLRGIWQLHCNSPTEFKRSPCQHASNIGRAATSTVKPRLLTAKSRESRSNGFVEVFLSIHEHTLIFHRHRCAPWACESSAHSSHTARRAWLSLSSHNSGIPFAPYCLAIFCVHPTLCWCIHQDPIPCPE